ncbi:unnamed protein product [Alternaria alternata]
MHSIILHFVLPTLLMVMPSSASQLFAADSRGNVSTLLLTENGNTSSLTVTSVTADCGPNPASLNLDYQNRILYCLDRGRVPGTEGSLNSLRIAADGSLSRIARVSAPFSGVAAEFFNDETGVRGYVSTSYNRSAIGVYRLPDDNGGLSEPAQIIFPNTTAVGPVTARQDRSYLHGVFLDPTRKFLLMTDLGQDRIRHAPSGGYSPRQLMINTDGDKIAVGHQNNDTVVMWKRDVETGKIVGEEDGGMLGVVTLSGPVVFAQWDP